MIGREPVADPAFRDHLRLIVLGFAALTLDVRSQVTYLVVLVLVMWVRSGERRYEAATRG